MDVGVKRQASHAYAWRRSLRRGVALGLVLSLHVGLTLFLLAPRPPRWQTEVVTASSPTDALQVEFPHRHPPAAVARVSTEPMAHESRAMRRRVPNVSSHLLRPPSAAPAYAASRAAITALNLRLPSRADGDGNRSWHEALGRTETRHRPPLPGMVAGSFVRQVRLRPRTSLKDSLRSIGTYLSCSAIRIQEEQTGHSAKLDRAAAEAGCGRAWRERTGGACRIRYLRIATADIRRPSAPRCGSGDFQVDRD